MVKNLVDQDYQDFDCIIRMASKEELDTLIGMIEEQKDKM